MSSTVSVFYTEVRTVLPSVSHRLGSDSMRLLRAPQSICFATRAFKSNAPVRVPKILFCDVGSHEVSTARISLATFLQGTVLVPVFFNTRTKRGARKSCFLMNRSESSVSERGENGLDAT